MKPLRTRLQEAAKAHGVDLLNVERDYAQTYLLLGITSQATLRDTLVFKGGTALKKIHFDNYRFSEDLDFSAVDGPKQAALERGMHAALEATRSALGEVAPVTIEMERFEAREPHPGGQEAFIVRVQFPWHPRPLVRIKVEITHDEPVLLPSAPRAVAHGYGEELEVAIRTYTLEEICAEKLRATRQTFAKLLRRGWTRPRGRDYFDLWHLVRLDPGRMDWAKVAEILPLKCRHRGVAIASIADVFEPAVLQEVRGSWARTVGPFVPNLPDVEQVLTETRARLERLVIIQSRGDGDLGR